MNNYLSDKIKILSFFLIILVLYIHSGFHADEIDGMNLNDLVQNVISGKLGRLAVPMFFIISGYLFFMNVEYGIISIKRKIKKRIKTILIPYILACLFFVLFLLTIQIIPFIRNYMNGDVISLFNEPISYVLKTIFWISREGNSPLAFQLWFLRDLIVIIGLSPILYYTLKLLKWWAIPLFFALGFSNIIEPSSLLSSLFWFSIGAVISFSKIPIGFSKKNCYPFVLFYMCLSILELACYNEYFVFFEKPIILIGIIGVWLGYDRILGSQFSLKENRILSISCSYTFFIYLFHEPTINVVRKLIVILVGKTSSGYLVSYLLSPLIFLVFCIFTASIIKTYFPKIFSYLVGGRV